MLAKPLAFAVCCFSLFAAAAPPEKSVEAESPAMVFSRVSGTVVLIRVETPRGSAQGSGVIVAKGKVVTNLHVVAGATRITVSLRGKDALATVFATSKPARDLALLSVDTTGGSRATLRKSGDLVVGERVFAVGNPRGYEQTLTDGLVSALRKEGDSFIVQTSAAISPGSSGGGLFDTRGRLVGITTKTRSDGQSLNFAHPVEWVTELLSGGQVSDAGVAAAPFSVTERPEAALCEFTEAARWGIFSEGIELLESSPTSGSVLLSALNSTQPVLKTKASSMTLVLKDMSRKTQVALFRGGPDEALVFTSFEDSGDVRATLAWVVNERGEARLVTHSGLCATGTTPALEAQLASKVLPERLPSGQDVCDVDAVKCYALASQRQGGERFLYLKKACRIGHLLACDEAIKLAQGVMDTANVASLQRYRQSARPMENPVSAPSPAVEPAAGGKRKPLKPTE